METPTFDLWLEFELYLDDYDPLEDFANVQVTLPDGRKYALNIWTFGVIKHLRYPFPYQEGVGTPAEYLLPPDLLVERLDRPTIERIIAKMLAANEMREEWLCAPEQ